MKYAKVVCLDKPLVNFTSEIVITHTSYIMLMLWHTMHVQNNTSLQLKLEASLPISHHMTFNFDPFPAPGSFCCIKKYTALILSCQ